MSDQFAAALLGAIVGAVVGSAITGGVAIWQTKTTLDQSAKLMRKAAEEERRATRAAVVRQVASAMLESLSTYMTPVGRGMRAHWYGGELTELERRGIVDRIADLQRHVIASAPLLPQAAADRWSTLVKLAHALNRPRVARSPHFDRMITDVECYAEYVRRALVAVVHETPLPPETTSPDLAREDQRVWGWKPPDGSDEPNLTDWVTARHYKFGEASPTSDAARPR